MVELKIKKDDEEITLIDKENIQDKLDEKVNKSQGSANANKTLSTDGSGNVIIEAKNNHNHDLKDLNIYADGQGGTNLIEGTQDFITPLTNVGLTDGTYQNCTYCRVDNTSGTKYLDISFKIPAGTFKHGEKYTLSFWAKGTGNIVVLNVGGTNYIKTKPINCTSGGTNTQNFSQYADGNVQFALTSEWKRYFVTWELNPTNNSTNDITVNKILSLRTIAGADAYWAGVMYERGEIPHDWSPSPKDIPRENITASSTSIANLNHYRKAGFYYNNNNNEAKYIIHCPNSDGTDTPYTNNHAFFLLVEDWGSVAYSVKQTLTYYDDDTIYIRRYVNGNWSTWEKTLNSSNYSTYASPNNHNHDGTYIKTGTGTVTSTNIADGTIVNADIADNAGIAYSKLSGVVSSTDSRLTNPRDPINNAIAVNSDLDDFKDAGFYYCQGDEKVAPTIVNQPLTSGGQRSFSMIVELISSTRVVQKLTYYSTKDTYIRTNINGAWSTWNRVLHSGNYSDYANKTTVTDNLTTDSSTNALSAKQGKWLYDNKANKSSYVTCTVTYTDGSTGTINFVTR